MKNNSGTYNYDCLWITIVHGMCSKLYLCDWETENGKFYNPITSCPNNCKRYVGMEQVKERYKKEFEEGK